ncbi:MAG: glycosyltransferase family 2 protein [Candidatus Micrarchaeia archaeon]
MKVRSDMPPPRVSIVVLNYNGGGIIAKCLESLRKTSYPNLRISVFDNGSTDDSREIVSGRFPDVEAFSTEKNLGVTKGMNMALSKALESSDADYIVFYTNDVQVNEPSWLSSLVDIAEKDRGIGIVGCKLLYPDRTIQHAGMEFWPDRLRGKGQDGSKFSSVEDMDAVTGACFLLTRPLLMKIGGVDEVFSPYYYEDTDFCFRARKAGFKIKYAGNVALTHHEGASMTTNSRKEYVLARNAMIFYGRYAPLSEAFKMAARIFVRLIVRRNDSRKSLSQSNISFRLSLGELVSFPYRFALVGIGIVSGLLGSGSSKVPSFAKMAGS